MKTFKKTMSLILAMVMLISMSAVMAGCGSEQTVEETVGGGESVRGYSVSVKSMGGMALEGIDIYVYADNTLADLVTYGETDAEGNVSFQMAENENYAIVVSGTPKGYEVAESYSFSGNSANLKLKSSVIKGENLAGASLGLGDIMYDFSVVTPAGETVTLSEMLEEKKMVLMNFWYTTCTYCVAEFPYMEEAYQQFIDDVGIIAVNPFEEGNAIESFQAQYGLSFPMASCPSSWSATFGVSGYPTSIIIDQYGVICLVEAGGITNLRPFLCMFEHFTSDEYDQKLFTALSELVTNVKPTYEMPTSEEIEAAINVEGTTVTYRGEEGEEAEYTWPFIITEKNGETCIKASNQEIDDSYAILYADVELKAGEAIGFDYLASTERATDIMHVIVNDEPIYSISGVSEVEEWKACYPWVAEVDGTYELALCYLKDESTGEGDDTVYVKDVRVVSSDEVDAETFIPRYAAVSVDGGFEYNYVDVVLNEQDGYYHVGNENGPLLLANLMNYTEFNEEKTIWDLAYDGDLVVGGHNYYDELVTYCNYASNSSLNGVCTVNEELAELLKIVADVAGFTGEENEWLKICKYYQVYGSDVAQLEDPILGLAEFSAYEAKLGKNIESNSFYYNRPILPRGLKAEFIPKTSGVYRITSRATSQNGVDGWLFGENNTLLLTYEHDERMYSDNDNVSMVYYMEAGQKYYIDIAFWDVYEVGTIYYDVEYLGATYDLFRACAPGYFTYDSDATGNAMYHLISGGIDVVLGEDGYYYHDLGKDANGNQLYGSMIYADFTGATGTFATPITNVPAYNEDGTIQKDENGETVMITGMIDMGGFDFSKTEDDLYILSFLNKHNGDVAATDAYLREMWGEDYDSYAAMYLIEDIYEGKYHGTGEDLTEQIKVYLDKIITTGAAEKVGCVPVDVELAILLQKIMDKYTFENVDDSWIKLCYYYDYLGK